MSIEDLNYYNDPRTHGPAKQPALVEYGCTTCRTPGESCDCPEGVFQGGDIRTELPLKWVVCSVCRGNGKHVNPSIDAGGLTREDFADDPDFAEDYMRGTYDVTCNRCNGRTTVQAVDEEACDPALLERYFEQLREEAEDAAIQRAELAMGC